MAKAKVIFIVGPTGTGKTEVGLSLSTLLPSEFISADSMQIYKGMDVVTDKLPLNIRKKHPYHLIDIIEPTEEYSVADFCQAARKIIKIILRKKKTPVVIGGTGLYINSLAYGIFEGKSADRNLRRVLEAEADARGTGFLHKRLEEIDPEAAHKIDPHNKRRIVRALEAYGVAQKPFSLLQKKRRGLSEDYDVFLFGLLRERGDLYARIDRRVDFMANAGLLDEVRELLKKKLSKTAYHCIGLREVEGFFKGDYDFDELLRLIKRNSRHFAKRQMTWFNKNKDIDWIDLKEDEDLSGVACLIYKKIKD